MYATANSRFQISYTVFVSVTVPLTGVARALGGAALPGEPLPGGWVAGRLAEGVALPVLYVDEVFGAGVTAKLGGDAGPGPGLGP